MPLLFEKSRVGGFTVMLLLLAAVLGFSFFQVFLPGRVLASNDAPLSRLESQSHQLPERFTGCWQDLNSVGVREPGGMPSISYALLYLLKPVGFAKFYAPFALFLLGLSAWYFLRQIGLSPPACVLGGLAAALNSDFFSDACWGVAGQVIAAAMTFCALAALVNSNRPRGWPWVILASLAVGMAVTEAADVGAILSLLVAAFVIHQAFASEGPRLRRLLEGGCRLGFVAVFAAVVSAQALTELVFTDVAGMSAARTASQRVTSKWDWATQWSLPKSETLSLVVPGLFGFRTDTANGGAYWGEIGRDPAWDQYDQGGRQGPAPTGFTRYTGTGFYAGVLVVLLAAWAVLQLIRGKASVFNSPQRKWLWFWAGTAVVSLLLAFGRDAPFYRLFFDLPYVSLIRNPVKFLHVFSLALVVLFAYGADGVWRKYLERAKIAAGTTARSGQKNGLSSDAIFDRNWIRGCWLVLAFSLLAWLWYISRREKLEHYLYDAGINSADISSTAWFSILQVGWFVFFFVLAAGAMAAIFSGLFARQWARRGAMLLAVILVADLVRANQPWIVIWNYPEIYASNAIVDELREKPYEQRVALLPMKFPTQLQVFEKLYRIVWSQGLFPLFNIQSLDIVQMSRMPDELIAYDAVFKRATISDFRLLIRMWQLTNTRFVLGPTASKSFLEQTNAPDQDKFNIFQRFDIAPRPGSGPNVEIGQLTAIPATNGNFALFEITGALPRAKLYNHWLVNTNDGEVLQMLTNLSFDPAKTVVVSDGLTAAPASVSNQDAGTVQFARYSPRDIVLNCDAKTPAVLLLNDRLDPNWKVQVDGRPKTILRCNYLMRGVQLDPGAHSVEFSFNPPVKALYVSVGALVTGLLVAGVTLMTGRRAGSSVPATAANLPPAKAPAPAPVPKPVLKPDAPRPAPAQNRSKRQAAKAKR
jgi:hypothetical protein